MVERSQSITWLPSSGRRRKEPTEFPAPTAGSCSGRHSRNSVVAAAWIGAIQPTSLSQGVVKLVSASPASAHLGRSMYTRATALGRPTGNGPPRRSRTTTRGSYAALAPSRCEHMKPDCIHCSRHLRLVADDGLNYWWRCEAGCAEGIDTGIPGSFSIEAFQRDVLRRGRLDMSRLARPLPTEYVSGARVYVPQLLYHFIECTWGACYNHLYLYCIAPYLDAPEVVDYILRTPVVRSSKGYATRFDRGADLRRAK